TTMAKRASPDRFAAEMAARLAEVVPSGFTVRSNGVSVDVYGGADDRHASAGATIIGDKDGRSLAERIETAAWAILMALRMGSWRSCANSGRSQRTGVQPNLGRVWRATSCGCGLGTRMRPLLLWSPLTFEM